MRRRPAEGNDDSFDFDELVARAAELQLSLQGRMDKVSSVDEYNNNVSDVVKLSVEIANRVEELGSALHNVWESPVLAQTCEILQHVPHAGTVFSFLLVLLESINQCARVERSMVDLLERTLRVISYLAEVVNEVGDATTNHSTERSFACFMAILDECMSGLVLVDKERWGTWSRIKRPWRASRHVKKLEDLNDKMDQVFLERGAMESIKTLPLLGRIEALLQQVNVSANNKPPTSIIPDCPKVFGRDNELEQLATALQGGGTMASLVGSAGMGKTHCAKHFARKWWEAQLENRFVLWISASSEQTIRMQYLEILKKLLYKNNNQDHPNVSTDKLAGLVWTSLGQVPYEWLLVFDDAPFAGPAAWKDMFLPTHKGTFGRGRILITSRSRKYRGNTCIGSISQVLLDRLDDETAVNMFQAQLVDENDDMDSNVIQNLVSVQLGGLPLAIETAVSEIVNRGVSVQEYVQDLNLVTVLDKVDAVLRSSLIRARVNDGLNEILDIAAFVNPHGIQLKLLRNDVDAVGQLRNLCLLSRVREGVFSIHQLHQEVARRGRSCTCAIAAVKQILDKYDQQTPDTWHLALGMVSHVESIRSTCLGSSEYQPKEEQVEAIAELLFKSGNVLHNVTCDYVSALSNYKVSLKIYEQVLFMEPTSFCLAQAHHQIGMVRYDMGDIQESRTSFERALTILRDPHNAETDAGKALSASTLFRLGVVYERIGDYEGAKESFSESITMNRLVLGMENESVADALHFLGHARRNVGKHVEALNCYEESLAMKRKLCGGGGSGTHSIAWTLHEMGCLFFALGDYEGAQGKFDDALKTEKSILGSQSHAYISEIENWRGRVRLARGDYSGALECFEEAESIDRLLLGPDAKKHLIAVRLSCVSAALQGLGDLDGALEKCNDSLEMFYSCFNNRLVRNEKVAASLCRLASILIDKGGLVAANTRLNESLSMLKEKFPDGKNDGVAEVHYEFGRLYRKRNDFKSAQLELNKARNLLSEILGEKANQTVLGCQIQSDLEALNIRERIRHRLLLLLLLLLLGGCVALVAVAVRLRKEQDS